MKKIYFVRHGQTRENVEGKLQFPEGALSEKGKEQAEILAARFGNIPIEVIVSSDMVRAKDTAKAVSTKTGKEVIESPLFRERSMPSKFRGHSKEEPEVLEMLRDFEVRKGSINWRHSDEETFAELLERAKSALLFLTELPQNTIAAVTHGGILRLMIVFMMMGDKLTLDEAIDFSDFVATSNTGVTLCEYRPDGENPFTHRPRPWRLISFNDSAHLG